jgi:hypothetical protein
MGKTFMEQFIGISQFSFKALVSHRKIGLNIYKEENLINTRYTEKYQFVGVNMFYVFTLKNCCHET